MLAGLFNNMEKIYAGMHHWNVSQIGSGYDGKEHYTHTLYEVDVCGEDGGIDFYRNYNKEIYFKCTGRFGTRQSGNTFFFLTTDKSGYAKKVLCADGKERVITLALTHSDRNAQIGKVYGFSEILVSEGTQGLAAGNHIHIEAAEGYILRKVVNKKGYYVLPNMLPLNNVLWICDDYTTVVNGGGIPWRHCRIKGTDEDMIYFIAKKGPVRIRKSLTYKDGKACGEVLATIPKGGKAEITHFTQRFEKDGYEWFQIRYVTETGKEINGYVQGDLTYYLLAR